MAFESTENILQHRYLGHIDYKHLSSLFFCASAVKTFQHRVKEFLEFTIFFTTYIHRTRRL